MLSSCGFSIEYCDYFSQLLHQHIDPLFEQIYLRFQHIYPSFNKLAPQLLTKYLIILTLVIAIIVMILKPNKKKNNKSPQFKKNKDTTKSKSKSKYKKKIGPSQYLQALIDLQNTNCSTNRKRKNAKRDISSALTVATPALEKTISSSKIRSKSSFSQYKKKASIQQSETVHMNIFAVITEQSNIHYTQKTPRESQNQQEQLEQLKAHKLQRQLNEEMCACKIQRAWRNYQTFKIVSEHYQIQQKMEDQRKNFNMRQLNLTSHKQSMTKKLRIKEKPDDRKQIRRNQQLTQTNKIIIERCKNSNARYLFGNNSPIENMLDDSMATFNRSSEIISDVKEQEVDRIAQALELIESKSKETSKELLINQLIQRFEENKRMLEEDIRQHFQNMISEKKQSKEQQSPYIVSVKSLKESDQLSFKENNHINIKSYLSDESSFDLQIGSIEEDRPQIKIFDQRLHEIKMQRNKKMDDIDHDVENGDVSIHQAAQKRQKVQEKYDTQRKQIEKNRKEYVFSLTKLKKNALKCHKQILSESNSFKKLRKSFSAGNTVLKTVLEEIHIQEIFENQFQNQFIDQLFKPHNLINQSIHLNTPVRSQPEGHRQSEVSEAIIQSNTQQMKRSSQHIQQFIQKYLFNEIVYQIYGNNHLFEIFNPYVGQAYEFKKIQDEQIINHIHTITEYLADNQTILKRVNQKINPTSLEILKIIRDFEFEIEEYQLIFPQQSFKKYRQKIEEQYKVINQQQPTPKQDINSRIEDQGVADLVYQREKQQCQKKKKYRNFQRDLKIMYMKSVFNCINEYLIELKSLNAYMNGRSSIGMGQLKYAIKQFNQQYDLPKYQKLIKQVQQKLRQIIKNKCSIPSFKNYGDLERYQQQITTQIKIEGTENEYKWVNYMDEVLEIWQDLSLKITDQIIMEAVRDCLY